MHIEELSWMDFKMAVANRQLEMQYFEKNNTYNILAFDHQIQFVCKIDIDDPKTSEQTDFEDNFQSSCNSRLDPLDPKTHGLKMSPKVAPDGWVQRIHEVEFTTSVLNSYHDKDYLDVDFGWTSLRFYEGPSGSETEITGANLNQTYLDANCTRTDLEFMPDKDYMLLGAGVAQFQESAENVYLWGLILDLDPPYNISIPPFELVEGGINLKYLKAKDRFVVEGRAPASLYYDGITDPTTGIKTPLPSGVGSNRIRYLLRHPVGFKADYQTIIEYYSA